MTRPGARFRFATRTIGETADITVLRDGAERTLEVEARPAPGPQEGERWMITGENPLRGAELIELSPAFNEENGIDPFERGVVVSRRPPPVRRGLFRLPARRSPAVASRASRSTTLGDLERALNLSLTAPVAGRSRSSAAESGLSVR
jgi:hypothetical protein